MVTGAGRTFAWDFDNRVDTVNAPGGSLIMAYDYTGIRVKKNNAGLVTYFPFSGYEVSPTGTITKYLRIGIENVVSKKSTGDVLFYHNDHLGGVNIITNSLGIMAQTVEYDPWGKVSREEGIGDSLRRFTGKQLDPESGLYYYGGRYYDPDLGRFISPDPFVAGFDDPQNLNRYSYVGNNPVNYIDPSGFKKKKKGGFFSFFKKFFGAIVGIVAAVVAGPAGLGLVASNIAAGAIGGAVAGAVNTAINGGNFAANVFGGALLGGIAGGIGPPIFGALGGSATASALTNFAAAVGTGAIVGGVTGALSTGIYGGKFGRNVGFGALGGAITAATMFGLNSAIASSWESQGAAVMGDNITTNPLIDEAMGTFEGFANTNLEGVQVFEANLAPGTHGQTPSPNTVLVNKAIVAGVGRFNLGDIRLLIRTLGHEFTHIVQARTSVFFPLKYAISNMFGYGNNRFEIQAFQLGNREFGAYALGQ